jgi:ribosomal protein S1
MSEPWNSPAVGDVVDGHVSEVMPFGVFVRVGEIDGFMPTQQPPAIGDPVRVRVVAVDVERERFAVEPL